MYVKYRLFIRDFKLLNIDIKFIRWLILNRKYNWYKRYKCSREDENYVIKMRIDNRVNVAIF